MVASLHNERLAWEINPCGDANFEEILTFIAQDSQLITELKSRGFDESFGMQITIVCLAQKFVGNFFGQKWSYH